MFDDDDFDAWDEEPEDPFEPEPDPLEDEESQPEPGDFWFDQHEARDE